MSNATHIKALLSTSKSRFASITFIKKNGESRVIVFNPATAKGIKGDKATESGKQAVATRKKNNPHLISVYDSSLARKGDAPEKCWRSVNLERVKKLSIGKEVYNFDEEE